MVVPEQSVSRETGRMARQAVAAHLQGLHLDSPDMRGLNAHALLGQRDEDEAGEDHEGQHPGLVGEGPPRAMDCKGSVRKARQ